MLCSFKLSKNKSDVSLMPKVVFTSLVVLMISSGMIILPAYALASFPFNIPPPLPAPTGLKATVVSSHSIQLSWNAVPTATSYTILRSVIVNGVLGFTKIGTSTTTSYLDQAAGSNSCYEVSAYGSHGGGYASTSACPSNIQTTPVPVPPITPPTTTATKPNGSPCTSGNQCQSGVCSSANICTPSSTAPTTPLTTTVTPQNPACQSVKTILTNSGYSVTVIAKVMADMNCS